MIGDIVDIGELVERSRRDVFRSADVCDFNETEAAWVKLDKEVSKLRGSDIQFEDALGRDEEAEGLVIGKR